MCWWSSFILNIFNRSVQAQYANIGNRLNSSVWNAFGLIYRSYVTHCARKLVVDKEAFKQGENGGFRILGFFWDFGISFGFSDFENPKIQSGYPLADNEISNLSFCHMQASSSLKYPKTFSLNGSFLFDIIRLQEILIMVRKSRFLENWLSGQWIVRFCWNF